MHPYRLTTTQSTDEVVAASLMRGNTRGRVWPFASWLRRIAEKAMNQQRRPGRSQHSPDWIGGRVWASGANWDASGRSLVTGGLVVREKTVSPEGSITAELVKAAFHDLGSPSALGKSPLGILPYISRTALASAELRAVLIDILSELTASPEPREAEAAHVLFDYYVKRVGTHELIMERLHLSRPTFYRRMNRGFALVAERLNELTEFTTKLGFETSGP